MKPYPSINDFGEIDWSFQSKELVQEVSQLGLASYDWYARAYVTSPVSIHLVDQLIGFARRKGVVIHPNPKLGLSLADPQGLIEHYFWSRLELSECDAYSGSLARPLNQSLSDYQKAAVLYAVHTRCCFIADPDAGDRQIEALAAVHQVQGYPSVLVCREQERADWLAQIRAYLPETIQALDACEVNAGTPAQSIWLLDYHDLEQGAGLPADAPRYHSVIVDHAHFVKNAEANRTQVVAALARKVRYRFLVTDFPVNLAPSDLKEPLEILGKAGEFHGLADFLNLSGPDPLLNREMVRSAAEHQRKLAMLYQQLRSTCLVRRAADPGLRSQNHIHPIELGPIPARINEETVFSDLRRFGLQKVTQAITWLRKFLQDRPGKVLIFAHHNDVVEEISTALDIPAVYGKISEEQRALLAAALASPTGLPALIVANDVELAWDLGQVDAIVLVELLLTPRQLYGIVDHLLPADATHSLPIHYLYARDVLDWDALTRLNLRLTDYVQILDGLEPEE